MQSETLLFLYFASSQTVYQIAMRSDRKTILAAFGFGSVFFFSAFAFVSFWRSWLDPIVLTILYLVTAFLPLLLRLSKNRSTGIIDFVWLSVIGFTFGGIVWCCKYPSMSPIQYDPLLNEKYYSQYAEELNFLLGKSIDMVALLGSILAACMTIVFSGEIWRKKDKQAEYEDTKTGAKKMVIAYFIVAIAVGIWVSMPLYNNYSTIKYLLK